LQQIIRKYFKGDRRQASGVRPQASGKKPVARRLMPVAFHIILKNKDLEEIGYLLILFNFIV
jgi:hypothetical protein